MYRCLILLITASLLLAACGEDKKEEATTAPTNPPATELHILNWDTYIDEAILDDFEQKFGVTITYSIFDNDSDLMEKIHAPDATYDLIIPSDRVVQQLRTEDFLRPLNKENIPNINNLDPTFINPLYDPGNRYCLPYQWGTIGIGYNIKATGREITSWDDFFDPAFKGRVGLMDLAANTLGVILIYKGYSPNSTSSTEINQASDFLIEHIDQVSAMEKDDGQDRLVAGDVDLVLEWSGDIFQVIEENPDIRYVIPEEGSMIWVDNMCIPNTAPHPEMAEAFMNYLLEPEVGAQLSNFVRYATPNQAAMPLINEEDRNNPAIYPPPEVQERLFFQVYLSADTEVLYNDAWAEVMAAYGN